MFRAELQHSFRHATARARPHLSIRGCPGFRRPEIVYLSARHDLGLPGNAHAARLRIRKPELLEVLRLRHVVFGLMGGAAGPVRDVSSLRRFSGIASPRKTVWQVRLWQIRNPTRVLPWSS